MKLTVPLLVLAGTLALPAAAQSYRDYDMWVLPWAQRGLVLPETPVPTEPTAPTAPTEPTTPPPDDLLAGGGVSPIPEPTTSALLLAGLGVVGLLYRRRSKRK
jgi:hypothetical protein